MRPESATFSFDSSSLKNSTGPVLHLRSSIDDTRIYSAHKVCYQRAGVFPHSPGGEAVVEPLLMTLLLRLRTPSKKVNSELGTSPLIINPSPDKI